MSIRELEKTVSQLPEKELAEFTNWFENFIADQWDKQIEADALAGKLNKLAQKADEDFEANHYTEL
jgi:hypothetical protein